jgi:ADP-ribose pyrophosphatase
MATVFKGRVFSVEVAEIQFPDGKKRTMEIVRHPPSIVLLPMQADGRVVLVRQFRPTIERTIWELPAGSVNAGESAEAAAARECEEEIGLVPARVDRLRGFYPAPGFCDEELIYFRVSGLTPPPPDSTHRPDEDEDIHSEAFTVADARALLARGEIIDLKTAYGLTLL